MKMQWNRNENGMEMKMEMRERFSNETEDHFQFEFFAEWKTSRFQFEASSMDSFILRVEEKKSNQSLCQHFIPSKML